jgi:hypothetical protein
LFFVFCLFGFFFIVQLININWIHCMNLLVFIIFGGWGEKGEKLTD